MNSKVNLISLLFTDTRVRETYVELWMSFSCNDEDLLLHTQLPPQPPSPNKITQNATLLNFPSPNLTISL